MDNFVFVSYDKGVLTTKHEDVRYHDFIEEEDDGDNVAIFKHFGDHDYESGSTVKYERVSDHKLINLIETAKKYYQEYG